MRIMMEVDIDPVGMMHATLFDLIMGNDVRATGPCPGCGGKDWWMSTSGGMHCAYCYQPVDEAIVARTFTSQESYSAKTDNCNEFCNAHERRQREMYQPPAFCNMHYRQSGNSLERMSNMGWRIVNGGKDRAVGEHYQEWFIWLMCTSCSAQCRPIGIDRTFRLAFNKPARSSLCLILAFYLCGTARVPDRVGQNTRPFSLYILSHTEIEKRGWQCAILS